MNRSLNRREFGTLVSTAGAMACSPLLAAEESESPGWIDAHVHVWTPDIVRYPLDSNYSVDAMKPRSFTPEELFAECRPAGVTRIVLIQMSFYNFDNRYMLDAIAAHPGVFSGVGIVNHRAPDAASQMRELATKGVRGFRLHARGEAARSWGDDPGMLNVWKTAAEEGLMVCPLINPGDLPYVDALCERFPDTGVVVDHFGRVGISGTIVPNELNALCRLARFPNVHVKTSAFYALGKKRPPYNDLTAMIERVVDAFGPSRLMWASDCPYQVQGVHDYESSIALIRDHIDTLSESDREWMLRKTAEKVFFA